MFIAIENKYDLSRRICQTDCLSSTRIFFSLGHWYQDVSDDVVSINHKTFTWAPTVWRQVDGNNENMFVLIYIIH